VTSECTSEDLAEFQADNKAVPDVMKSYKTSTSECNGLRKLPETYRKRIHWTGGKSIALSFQCCPNWPDVLLKFHQHRAAVKDCFLNLVWSRPKNEIACCMKQSRNLCSSTNGTLFLKLMQNKLFISPRFLLRNGLQ
jgi:hypothetical protein